MGLRDFFRKLLGQTSLSSLLGYNIWENKSQHPDRHGLDELARRLDVSVETLTNFQPAYNTFSIPKRSGGVREISTPSGELKEIQKKILHKLLGKLPTHPCAVGFEKGHSIVTNAFDHQGADVVIKMDIRDFFAATGARRVERYFRRIGWDAPAARRLAELCAYQGSLPQGAPTSPRLSNLLNYQMDVRLAALANSVGARYTRYADDMTFSVHLDQARQYAGKMFQNPKTLAKIKQRSDGGNVKSLERFVVGKIIIITKQIIREYGYTLHQKRKLQIRRRHQQQKITGLVVNDGVNLPRHTRRWFRAVENRMKKTGQATITPQQYKGWLALKEMIETQKAALENSADQPSSQSS